MRARTTSHSRKSREKEREREREGETERVRTTLDRKQRMGIRDATTKRKVDSFTIAAPAIAFLHPEPKVAQASIYVFRQSEE